MKIPDEVRNKYLTKADPEASFFLDHFDEDLHFTSDINKDAAWGFTKQVLEVGANDNLLAEMLAEAGFIVDSIDLMEYGTSERHKRHKNHFVGDFCDWAGDNPCQPYHIIYSVSAIEHFGLGTYNKENYRPYHDVIAMRYIYDLLKPGGVAYIAVPFAGKYVELRPHWRTYDYEAIMTRIVQDFNVELFETRVVEWNLPECGQRPSAGFVAKLTHGEPYVSCLLKLRKGKKNV